MGAYPKNVLALLILITVLGAVLRLYGLETQSLSNDELGTLYESSPRTLSQVIGSVRNTYHPPGYVLFMHFALKFIGDSEAALRLPSAIAGILSIPAIFLLGSRLFSHREGLIASALVAFLWFPVYYSQEARSYSILLLLSILTTYLWLPILKSLDADSKIRMPEAVGYILAAAASGYTHYYGGILVSSQGACTVIFFLMRRKALLRILLIYSAIIILFIPWIPMFMADLNAERIYSTPLEKLRLEIFLQIFFNKSPDLWLLVSALYLLLISRIIYGAYKSKAHLNVRKLLMSPDMLVILWLIIPFSQVYLKSRLENPSLSHYGNLIIILPAAYLLLARAITKLPISNTSQAIVAIIVVTAFLFNLISDQAYYSRPIKAQFREAAYYLADRDAVYGDSFVVGCSWDKFYFDHYFQKRGSQKRVDVKSCGEDMQKLSKAIADKNPRYVWLIYAHRIPDKTVISRFGAELKLIENKSFIRAGVFLYENPKSTKASDERAPAHLETRPSSS
ncbi:MAG: glycosyltransferase family 39 protein [Candidatus Altiarchaeota archaeon]